MQAMIPDSIAFGSCNKQTLPQDFWDNIAQFEPQKFLWTGDAVYTKGRSLQHLSEAYKNLTSNDLYAKFSERISIDGVWDDHDYGVNDGGKFVKNKEERVGEYIKFLTGISDKKLRDRSDNVGIYHSTDVALGDVTAKVIFLDTRYFRDNHYIFSLGQYPIKGSAVVGSLLRGLYSTLGFGRQYAGELLGDAQWQWLKQTLLESAAQKVDLNIIVSSVQVLTSNPLFESWAHFPIEKRRLFDLLAEADPKNLVFLSGDVHLGEVSQATFTREDGSSGKWTEITSSGLTHSCSEGLTGLFCPGVTALFSQHRRDQKSIYLKRNFGLIQATPLSETGAAEEWNVEFSVRALPSTDAVLSHHIVIDKAQVASASPIVGVQYPDFPQVPLAVIVVFLFAMACVLRVMLYSYRKKQAYLKRQQKRH